MVAAVVRAGQVLTVYDLDPARAQGLDGVEAAASAAEAALGADVLFVMVATPEQVESVLFGDDGAAGVLEAGAVVVITATVGPAPIARWAATLAERDVELIDAPVSGGVARAGEGNLLIMVSGAEDAIARVQPLLDALARNAPVVGSSPGDGQKVKLVNQLLCGVHIAAAGEALAFAEALGLDARACWEVIRDGAAASFMLDDRGARMLDGDVEPARSALEIFVKDMGLVTGAARENAYPTPLGSVAEQLYLAGSRAGLGRLDDSSIIRLFRGGSPSR
jgi:3-hydroxyisobutyrate dehydrogenase/putative dehydrogenase